MVSLANHELVGNVGRNLIAPQTDTSQRVFVSPPARGRHPVGGCPTASPFLLLRQKKVTKEKATPIFALILRCSQRAGPAQIARWRANARGGLMVRVYDRALLRSSGSNTRRPRSGGFLKCPANSVRYWCFFMGWDSVRNLHHSSPFSPIENTNADFHSVSSLPGRTLSRTGFRARACGYLLAIRTAWGHCPCASSWPGH